MSTFIKQEQESLEKKISKILKKGMVRTYEDNEIIAEKRKTFERCLNHVYMQKAKNIERNELYLKKKYKMKDFQFYKHITDCTGYHASKYKKFKKMYQQSQTYPENIFFNAFILSLSFNIDVSDIQDKDLEFMDKKNMLRKQF